MQRSSRMQRGFKANKIMRNVSRHRKKPLLAKDIWEDDKKITQGLVKQGNTVLLFQTQQIFELLRMERKRLCP